MIGRNPTRSVLFAAVLSAAACAESPTAPTEVESPVTVTFASNLYPRGTVTWLVTALQAGTVAVTLESLAEPVAVGLALGLARADGAGCHGTTTVNATAGSSPQLASVVDAGNYCVSIYDIGNLTAPTTFSITVVHP